MFKKMIRGFFRRRGLELVRIENPSTINKGEEQNTMSFALSRLKKLGIVPNTIVDVGAASGNWSTEVHSLWPAATIIAFEPLKEQIERLKKNTLDFQNQVKVFEAVAGEKNGEIDFTVTDDPDGSGVYGAGKGELRKLPVMTINDSCKNCSGPFLIKLDTHGFELPILNGALEILPKTDAVIIEVYGFYVSPTAPLFHQVSEFMEKQGFRLFDVVDVMRRKKDEAFWQCDAVYLRASHKIFSDNNYR